MSNAYACEKRAHAKAAKLRLLRFEKISLDSKVKFSLTCETI